MGQKVGHLPVRYSGLLISICLLIRQFFIFFWTSLAFLCEIIHASPNLNNILEIPTYFTLNSTIFNCWAHLKMIRSHKSTDVANPTTRTCTRVTSWWCADENRPIIHASAIMWSLMKAQVMAYQTFDRGPTALQLEGGIGRSALRCCWNRIAGLLRLNGGLNFAIQHVNKLNDFEYTNQMLKLEQLD